MFDSDVWRKLKRGPQVVLLKDAAFISAFTGLQSGDIVVDAGSGSGFLAVYLGSIVAPGGRVFSYEWRDDFVELAKGNVKRAGLENVVEVKFKDVFEGIAEKDVDLVTLDLANAEKALAHANEALKPKGWIVCFNPNVEQAKAVVEEAQRLGLRQIQTMESFVRELLIRKEGTRPETKGLLHTAYLTFLRKA
jgi:tRNA (adenine57-N1/adenine58-N1)-methyltransferase